VRSPFFESQDVGLKAITDIQGRIKALSMENPISVFVNFDRAKPGYSPKDKVTGNIYIKANVDCTVSTLDIYYFTCDVETGAREGEIDVHPVSNYPLKQGEGKAFPFLFLPPSDPYQWSNSNESADWFVEAKVEIQTKLQGRQTTLNFDATEGYSILERPENYRKSESSQAEPLRKKAKNDDSTPISGYITGILFSLIFWGIAYFGLILTMNGYSERHFPDGVRYFGIVAMLGSFFVIGKLYASLGKGISYVSSGIVMAISLLAFYAFAVGPTFDDTEFALAFETPKSILFSPVSAPQLLFVVTGFALLMQSGLFFYAKDPKRNGLWELAGLIPSYCCVALAVSVGVAALSGVDVNTTTLRLVLLIGVIGLVMIGTTLRRPNWNNLPKGLAFLASAPLFFIGIMQLPICVEPTLPSHVTFQWLFSALMILGGGIILVFGNRNLLAGIQLGKVEAIVEPTKVPQGGFVEIKVKFQPLKGVLVNGIKANLVCHRSRIVNRGTKSDREDWIDFDQTTVSDVGRVIQAGENFEQLMQVVFPAGCQRSGSDCFWELRLRIDAAKAIDWEEIYRIEVI
jgi:hypothetical protein